MKLQALLMPLALVSLALAGCTGGGGEEDGFVTPPMEGGAYVIKIVSNRFVPEKAVVPAGSTVSWVMESGAHNVVPDGHNQWQGKPVTSETGEHLRVTFQEPGEYPYYCQPHRSIGMVGVLKVE